MTKALSSIALLLYDDFMPSFFKEKDAIAMGLTNNIDPTKYNSTKETKQKSTFVTSRISSKPKKKKRKSAKKSMSIKAHANVVWKFARRVFRKTDAINRGDGEYVKCCTCPLNLHWEKCDAGHFVSRQTSNLYFDFKNVHCQCRNCNRLLESNHDEYRKFMIQQYGEELTDKYESLKFSESNLTHAKLDELRDFFINKAIELHI